MRNPRILFLCVCSLLVYTVRSCTLICVGKDATSDGSVIVAHTDDAGGGTADLRLVRVPAADWPKGSKRPVYNFFGGYPRLVDEKRSPLYAPRPGQSKMKPLGHIPQVEHTYAYYSQDYGLANEKQLIIGESTCGARTVGFPLDVPYGKNLFGIAELSNIALERCDTARCAIQTMGDLATKYGFYDEDSGTPEWPGYPDSAETLGIGDRHGEVWVFHILTAPDGGSAIWAAQRVPDGHVAAVANAFTIRQMNLSDTDNFMASKNVLSIAIQMGWWRPREGPFDFTAAYAYTTRGPVVPLYGGRRIWRIFDLAAPSMELDPSIGWIPTVPTYPFSVEPDTKLSLQWIFRVLRDHYEGTEFDMTQGLSAGPFNSPIRYDGWGHNVSGGWERPIAMFRTTFSFAAIARPTYPDDIGGLFWYGQDTPHATVYVPFYSAQDSVPDSYITGNQSVFNRDSAWWAFDFVSNWVNLKYSYMIKEVIRESSKLEEEGLKLQREIDLRASSFSNSKDLRDYLAEQTNRHAEKVVKNWWEFGDYLVGKYANGYITTGEQPSEQRCPGYSEFWLRNTEYAKWPPAPNRFASNLATKTAPVPVIPDPSHPGHYQPAYFDLSNFGQQQLHEMLMTPAYSRLETICFLIVGLTLGVLAAYFFLRRHSPSDAIYKPILTPHSLAHTANPNSIQDTHFRNYYSL